MKHSVHFGSVHCLLEQRLSEPLHLQYALSDLQLLEELYLLGGEGSKEGWTLELPCVPLCVLACTYIQLHIVRLRHCLSVSGQLFEEVNVRIKESNLFHCIIVQVGSC